MQEVQENQSTFINCCWSGHRVWGGGGWEEKSVPSIVPRAELMHAWAQSPSPTQRGRVPTCTRACIAYMKGKEGLKGDALLLIWLKGGFVEGQGGWRTVPGDQWKSWALTCRTCEKDLLLSEKVLKAAVKVAVGVKHPTLYFTTNCHSFAKTHKLLKTREWSTVISQLSPNGSSYMPFLFLQARVNFSCFNHRWLIYF